jgi:hypothetical protein
MNTKEIIDKYYGKIKKNVKISDSGLEYVALMLELMSVELLIKQK